MSNLLILPITVMIPTMNRPEALKRTLDSLTHGKAIPSQIVVVDQSKDEEYRSKNKEIVESINQFCEAIYFYQSIPSSTMARNNAFSHAKEEICVFSDDDVDLYENTLGSVYEIMKDNRIAMIAGIDDNTPSAATDIGFILGTKSYRERNIGHVTLSMLGRFPDNIEGNIETHWAMGYFFVIRKSIVDKFGLCWDEKLKGYAYAEDLDFSYQYYKCAKKLGLDCILSDKVRVRHLVSKEYRIPSKESTFKYVLNRRYISHKHGMGMKSRIAMNWCDFWYTIGAIVKREPVKDMVDALCYYRKHVSQINKGIFPY